MILPHRISVIGAGNVGASIAYAIMLRKMPVQLLLVDIDAAMVHGQVLDLNDASFLSPTRVYEGSLTEAGQSDVVVVTAGAKQRVGETRAELVGRNERILSTVIHGMQPMNPNAMLLIVANPVEVLTSVAQCLSGLPRQQVFGSGTFLDSMRLRHHLANTLKVNDNALHCYVLGEHGDHQFIAWDAAHCGPTPIDRMPSASAINREQTMKEVRDQAYDIIKSKGATYYGIGACVASLCESLLYDRKDVRCVSTWNAELGSVVSWPAVIGRAGVEQVLTIQLGGEDERRRLAEAVQAIKDGCAQCACLKRSNA